MSKFEIYFAVRVGALVLSVTDNLSKTLQHSHMTASEGQDIAKRVVKCLETMRSDRDWELFREHVNQGAKKLDLPDAEPPRKRRRPQKYEEGLAPPEFLETAEAHHRIWAEVHDWAISAIKRRFDQPGYKTTVALEDLLSKAANGEPFEDSLTLVKTYYDGDFDVLVLRGQLQLMKSEFKLRDDDLRDGELWTFSRCR